MSSEKAPLSAIPQSPLPDAPPAYDTLTATATLLQSITTHAQPTTAAAQPIMLPADPPPPPTLSPPPFRPPPPVPPKTHKRSGSTSSTTSLKSKKSWFQFSSPSSSTAPAPSSSSSARTVSEVRTTVLGLVRDLVRDHSAGSGAALGILASCADVCASHGIPLAPILQDPSIEGHSPLYWAIVKRPPSWSTPPDSNDDGGDGAPTDTDLVGALLRRCAPLTPDTVSELRLACLATSDQAMFQRLRPHFSATSGTDRVLLGADPPPDDVRVEIGAGTEGAFSVAFTIPEYHKRMMISKEIGLEFVARNRIWRFALLIIPDGAWYGPPPGSWCIALSLREPSPPTWLDAQLTLSHPGSEAPITKAPPALQVRSKHMLEAPRNGAAATQLLVPLDGTPAFAGLQYSGNEADGTLRLRLEAKLRKPSAF